MHVRDQRMCPVDVSLDRSAGIGPVLLPAATGVPTCASLALLRSMDVDPMSLAPLFGGLRFAIGEKKPQNKPSGQKSGGFPNKMRKGKLITVRQDSAGADHPFWILVCISTEGLNFWNRFVSI